MMIANSRRGYNQGKQEGEAISIENFSKAASNSRQWSGLRNPRIVRVSRSFGGKDRHSKVCTIRGLRDRRIRLSVPTAIQLYDLQDRLGLSQPSKVIDWLIEATKHDIDKLPPLQIPQGFAQTLLPHHDQPSLGAFYDANSTMFKDAVSSRIKGKEDERAGGSFMEKGKWIKTNEQETEDGINYAQNLFPIASTSTHSFLPGLLNNTVTYNNHNPYHWEPSNLSLFGSHGLFPSSQVDPHSVQFPSLPGSQLFFCPASATPSFLAPYNAPYMATSSVESDPRSQFNHVQFLSSSSQVLPHHPPSLHDSINSSPLKPLPTPFSSRLLDSEHKNTTRS